MLWQLDAGREVLRLPGDTRRDCKRLGNARRRWPFPVNPPRACAIDDRADEHWRARPEPGWQETLRPRLADPGRIGALRCEIRTVHAVPFGNLGDGIRLLS